VRKRFARYPASAAPLDGGAGEILSGGGCAPGEGPEISGMARARARGEGGQEICAVAEPGDCALSLRERAHSPVPRMAARHREYGICVADGARHAVTLRAAAE